jgi:hypothetical protein
VTFVSSVFAKDAKQGQYSMALIACHAHKTSIIMNPRDHAWIALTNATLATQIEIVFPVMKTIC